MGGRSGQTPRPRPHWTKEAYTPSHAAINAARRLEGWLVQWKAEEEDAASKGVGTAATSETPSVDTPARDRPGAASGEYCHAITWDGKRSLSRADYTKLVATFNALAETSTEIPVIFDIKPEVFMGDQLAVQTAANNAGFQNIKFATEAKSQAKQ